MCALHRSSLLLVRGLHKLRRRSLTANLLFGEVLNDGEHGVLLLALFLDIDIMSVRMDHLDAVHFRRVGLLLREVLHDSQRRGRLVLAQILDVYVARFGLTLHKIEIIGGDILLDLLFGEILHDGQRGLLLSALLGDRKVFCLLLLFALAIGALAGGRLNHKQVIFILILFSGLLELRECVRSWHGSLQQHKCGREEVEVLVGRVSNSLRRSTHCQEQRNNWFQRH